MDRRSCLGLAAFGTAAMTLKAPAARAAALPIVLYADLPVDPAREGEFLAAYHTHFKPVARKHEGYVDLTIAKIEKTLQGASPAKGVNYRFQLTWQNEALRQKWVASADHVKNWPLLEKTLIDKNYSVILAQAV
jgi:hypothetical protein